MFRAFFVFLLSAVFGRELTVQDKILALTYVVHIMVEMIF